MVHCAKMQFLEYQLNFFLIFEKEVWYLDASVNCLFKSWQLVRKQTSKPKRRNASAGHLERSRPWSTAAVAGCRSLQTDLEDPLMGTALVDSQPVVLRCHPQLRIVADSTCRGGVRETRHTT